jgi:hypothetical protein
MRAQHHQRREMSKDSVHFTEGRLTCRQPGDDLRALVVHALLELAPSAWPRLY